MRLLAKRNLISLPFKKFFICAFLFGLFVSFDAAAQDERTRIVSDSPDGLEQVTDIEAADFSKSSDELGEGKSPLPQKENKDHLSRQRGEKDVRKEGVSTLSFNLFLYVIDRFKEDN